VKKRYKDGALNLAGTGEKVKVKRLAAEVIPLLPSTITVVIFWHYGPEVSKLKGALSDLILFPRSTG
jgi:hypothetical protein